MNYIKIHSYRQWNIEVDEDESGAYRIVNRKDDGTLQYYLAESGKYGEPIIVPEPELALPIPLGCKYVDSDGTDAQPSQLISGIICSAGGKVVHRFSLTNAMNKGVQLKLEMDGRLMVAKEHFWLRCLLVKDRNRFRNYDAFFVPTRQERILVAELEDVAMMLST